MTGIWGFSSVKLRESAGTIKTFFFFPLWLRSDTTFMTIKGKGLLPLTFTSASLGLVLQAVDS